MMRIHISVQCVYDCLRSSPVNGMGHFLHRCRVNYKTIGCLSYRTIQLRVVKEWITKELQSISQIELSNAQ